MYKEERATEVADSIISLANTMGGSDIPGRVVEKLLNCHRTLNQSITSNFILPFIRGMALKYRDHNYDLRNEAAVQICHFMWKKMCEEYKYDLDADPRLPLI